MPPERPAFLEMREIVALAKPCSWIEVMVAAMSWRRRRSSIPTLGMRRGLHSRMGEGGRPQAHPRPPSAVEVFYFDRTSNKEKLDPRQVHGKDSTATNIHTTPTDTGQIKETNT